jgi:hypothetical protein
VVSLHSDEVSPTLPSYFFRINFNTLFPSASKYYGYSFVRQNVQSPAIFVLHIEIFPLVLPEESSFESSQQALSLQLRIQLLYAQCPGSVRYDFVNIVTDLIKALLDNSSVNTFQRATIEAMSQ